MARSAKQSSPLVGWMEAGADLVAARLVQVAELVNQKIDASHSLLDELQHRGEAMDEKLRSTLKPSSVISSVQEMVMSNPLLALVPGLKKGASKREQQIALLSAKIDLLVEQVALLAAKQAVEQKQKASVSSTTRRKSTATKTTESKSASQAKAAADDAASPATKKKPATRRTTTRKTTSTRKPAATSRTTKTSAKTEGDKP